MLFYQMSRMCREKGAVKHDDRLDCLAQGVKWFTEALAISAQQNIILRKQEDWNDMQEAWLDDPEQAATHMVMGMSLEQRKHARGLKGDKSVYNSQNLTKVRLATTGFKGGQSRIQGEERVDSASCREEDNHYMVLLLLY